MCNWFYLKTFINRVNINLSITYGYAWHVGAVVKFHFSQLQKSTFKDRDIFYIKSSILYKLTSGLIALNESISLTLNVSRFYKLFDYD